MGEFPIRRAGTEQVDLDAAEGRILAQEVTAAQDVPAFNRSMVDGYAVIASDVRGASRHEPATLILAGEVAMGKAADLTLRNGEAIAVPTGGALPLGTTGIIKVEDTKIDGQRVLVYDADDCDDRITQAASDVRAGERLFARGTCLSPAMTGLLAAVGMPEVTVYRMPTVAVLVTGDELVPAGQPLGPGQIHETNGIAIRAALAAMGCAPRRYPLVADRREALAQAFERALSECDAVIISGGSSVGLRDHTPAVVAQAGQPGVVVHGVRAKPGRPVVLAMIGDQPVIGLPGNPVSALVMFEALAKPILLRMVDKPDDTLPVRARLETAIVVDAELEHRIAVQLVAGPDGPVARPLLGSSSQLHILAHADAIIVVPEGSGGLGSGALVDALPLSRTRTIR
jgi:molybdenum cofactor synthesis domain-containing protein